ncbi:polyprenyl synthetase family protein, partial [Patescibacteria group bacterium]|nr:polyprenyl synthetase family protein [Patescibacteria group bacterium]MBU1457790.1 polyprenyl synthetase family protein [Patescibacteria group bacterium]
MFVDNAPVVHTWITHVHKEKGLFLDLIGESNNIPDEIRKSLAMSADLLWTLSLIIDDITDVDVVRGGLEVAWQKYGTQESMASATECLQRLLKYLAVKTCNPQVAYDGVQYVQMGINSLEEHRHMTLGTSVGEIVRNYERRCDFHATFQLLTMARLTGKEEEMQTAAAGLRYINQAGQLINDLKDFVGGDLYARGFSDISRSVPTVPIRYMVDGLQGADKVKFRSLLGHTLNSEDMGFLVGAIKRSG